MGIGRRVQIIERPHRTKNTQVQVSHYGDVQLIYIVYPNILGTPPYSSSTPCRTSTRVMKLSIILAPILAVSVHAVNKKSLEKNEQAMFFDGKQLLALQQFPAKVDR